MWGSTEPSTAEECNWANTPFNNGSSYFNSDYFNAHKSEWLDSKDNLKPEFDAAYKATDGAARMPTASEYETLYNKTLWVWCPGGNVGIKKTNESGNESIEYIVYPKGYFVFKTESDKKQMGAFTTDKNGNLIGYTATSGTVYYPGAHEVTKGNITSIADGDTHIFFPASGNASGSGVHGRGSDGYYWSSSLHSSYSGYGLYLYFDSGRISPQGSRGRCDGFCVRSVLGNLS